MFAAACLSTGLKRAATCPSALLCQEVAGHRKTEMVFSTSREGGRGNCSLEGGHMS